MVQQHQRYLPDHSFSEIKSQVVQLQEALGPQSVIHKDRDVAKLRAHVKSAEILIRSLPCAPGLQEDINIAVKGIIKQAPQTKKKRPELNMEDDDEYY